MYANDVLFMKKDYGKGQNALTYVCGGTLQQNNGKAERRKFRFKHLQIGKSV